MANKIFNGKVRLVIWIVSIVFAAGGLATIVFANSRVLGKHNGRLQRIERAVAEFSVIKDDVQLIKKILLEAVKP